MKTTGIRGQRRGRGIYRLARVTPLTTPHQLYVLTSPQHSPQQTTTVYRNIAKVLYVIRHYSSSALDAIKLQLRAPRRPSSRNTSAFPLIGTMSQSTQSFTPSAVSAPGKVLLAGGYLVLDEKYSGLVFALSARIHCASSALPSLPPNTIKVDSPQFTEAEWTYQVTGGDNSEEVKVTQVDG
jgi:hypothetical protein